MFRLFLVFYVLCLGYCSNLTGFNFYYTDIHLNTNDHHCLYYFVPETNFAHQLIEYCIRFPFDDELLDATNKENSFTFEELYEKNITSQQLYDWSASIDLIESYQNYLENNISTNKYRFYNCTYPWFGPHCQYRFQQPLASFDEQIEQIYRYKSDLIYGISPTLSCYTYLKCNRAGNQNVLEGVCLDWREVCNGKIDCIDGGHDEDLCWLLEINDCDNKTEYRCQNGLCIPLAFLQDDEIHPDCLDRSDEPRTIKSIITSDKINSQDLSTSCYLNPTFRCEESMCHPSNDKTHHIACGDGSCVNNSNECWNKRKAKLFDAFWFGVNISDECRHSMKCFTTLIGNDFVLENCPDNPIYHAKLLKQYCPKLVVLPPILYGHVQFVYVNNQSLVNFSLSQARLPDYICYDGKLCDEKLFSILLHAPIDLLNNNSTCRSLNKSALNNENFRNYHGILTYFSKLFRKCSNNYQSLLISTNSNLYRCMNSSKIISQYRLLDGIEDCLYGDDETYNQSCSLENFNQRFPCDQDTNIKCLVRSRVFDNYPDCSDGSDEPRQTNEQLARSISFQIICNGYTELPPMIMDGQNVTDETECTYFSCNNIYTRCDGLWNCPDGIDEINCEWPPICPRNHHMCISSTSGDMICLHIQRVNDGIIDCLGGSDERHNCRDSYKSNPALRYQCSNSSTCISVLSTCLKPSLCPGAPNMPISFCQDLRNGFVEKWLPESNLTHIQQLIISFMDKNKPINVYFSLVPATSYVSLNIPKYPEVPLPPPIRISQDVLNRDTLIYDNLIGTYCNRGIPIHRSVDNRNNTAIVCFCPPAYHGHLCQYQNQRVSLTVQVKLSFEFYIPFIFILTLRDDEQNLIESYDRIEYLYKRDCTKKFNIYLLYANRPKNTLTNHSVHIDVFNRQTQEYRASWLFPIKFPFLPVYRLAIQLQIPSTKIPSPQNCKTLNCGLHGQCSEYVNTKTLFCLCNEGWSGTYCDIPHPCNCSLGSFCFGPNICTCPLNKFGTRCSLPHLPCSCENNGTCIRNDERMSQNKDFHCICPEGFSGLRCEQVDTQITQSFSSDMSIPSSIFMHFIEVFGKNQSHIQSTIPKKIAIDEETVSIYRKDPFHLMFIEIDQTKTYYLSILQQKFIPSINISSTIKSSDRCLSINEVFNETISSLHLLRRIKYYHIPCQQQLNLSCFYDDIHMCICNQELQQANCLTFNYNQSSYDCGDQNPCENQGQCFRDSASCPTTFLCICDECSYGSRCQVSTEGIGLSLDAILGYHIKPNLPFTKQPLVIYMTLTIVTLMLIVGIISNIFSICTFQTKKSRESGCGYYLLASSYTSLIITILFAVKFYLFLVSQLGLITNYGYLNFNCIFMEYLLKVLLSTSDWFNAVVGIERMLAVWQDTKFNKTKATRLAKRMIILIYIITFGTHIHEPIYRRMIEDAQEHRSWCHVKFSKFVHSFNGMILTLHFIIPFILNIVSALVIITRTARQRARAQRRKTYGEQLRKQFKDLKHLLISPIILIILATPRLIIAFSSGCMKTTRGNPWLYILGYLVSFSPSMLLIVVFILPSKTYKKELKKAITQIRRYLSRHRL